MLIYARVFLNTVYHLDPIAFTNVSADTEGGRPMVILIKCVKNVNIFCSVVNLTQSLIPPK